MSIAIANNSDREVGRLISFIGTEYLDKQLTYHWLQNAVRNKNLEIVKLLTNAFDIPTKTIK